MGKKLNIDSVRSELSQGSAFFPSYKRDDSPATPSENTPPVSATVQTRTPSTSSTPVPPVRVVPDVPPVPAKKRVMKQRHPFDIYQDQYNSLQEISLAERKLGLTGSQSAMAREALDWIISKKKKELNLE